jgi:hypothetical protein
VNLFFELAKKILSGNDEGKEELSRIVDGIIKEIEDDGMDGEEDYNNDVPGFEGTMDALDDITIRPKSAPTKDYNMDKILEKIFSDGMESLTKGEKDYLTNQSK